ncbi:MAG TPA: hypothetical protein VF017_21895 [Thermoanaerobaculia bacterium]|nr:hypothetical protein [Thermoanaerobaculia bacterium]
MARPDQRIMAPHVARALEASRGRPAARPAPHAQPALARPPAPGAVTPVRPSAAPTFRPFGPQVQRAQAGPKASSGAKKAKWDPLTATPGGPGPHRTHPGILKIKPVATADQPYLHAVGRVTVTFRVLQLVVRLYRAGHAPADATPRHQAFKEPIETAPWQSQGGGKGKEAAHVLLRTVYIQDARGLRYLWNLETAPTSIRKLLIGLHAHTVLLDAKYNKIDGLLETALMTQGALQKLLGILPMLARETDETADRVIWSQLTNAYSEAIAMVASSGQDFDPEAFAVYARAAKTLSSAGPLSGFDAWVGDITKLFGID